MAVNFPWPCKEQFTAPSRAEIKETKEEERERTGTLY